MTVALERRGTLEVARLCSFDALGCDVVVTTRAGGVSRAPYDTCNLGDHVGDDPAAVAENRRRLAAAMGVAAGRLVLVRQVHGATVADAGEVLRAAATPPADALVTDADDLAVCVLVADCVPLVALDPVVRVLAVAHAGWRGVAGGVVGATLHAMAARGAVPERLHVALGPCIGGAAYQVGGEVAAALRDAGCASAVSPDGTGRYVADLAAACRAQLVGAGVEAAHLQGPFATTNADHRFFSDRRERPCGRFALAARLTRTDS